MKLLIIFLSVVMFAKNILILNSYSVQFPWTKGELEGILQNFKHKKDIKLYIEFMDTKLFAPTPEYINNFSNYLKTKYKNLKFDIVITTDDNALRFALTHNKFFKDSKIFFAGVNDLCIAKIIDRNRVSGVFEKKEPLANLKFLKKVVPDLKKVYVVADNSNSANAVMKEYKKELNKVKNLEFVFINDENLSRVINKIKNYKNSGMLLLTPFSFKLNSHHINYKKAITLISNNYPKPIVIHTDILASLANTNIVGGRVTDAISQGNSVSKKVLLYLNGKKVKDIPLTYEKANKMYLNVKNLKKFNIEPEKLGYKNAVYVNKPNDYDKYKKYLMFAFLGLIFLTLFVIMLLYKNYKLAQYKKSVEKISEKLDNDLKEKYKDISNNYTHYLEIKLQALRDIILIMLRRINKLYLENDNFMKEFMVFYDWENNNLYIKEFLKSLATILNKNVEIIGEDFELNLDKILFAKVMIELLEDNSKIILKNKKIIINYPYNVNFDLKNIKKILDLNIELNKDKLVIDLG